jgi:hypothetical protein
MSTFQIVAFSLFVPKGKFKKAVGTHPQLRISRFPIRAGVACYVRIAENQTAIFHAASGAYWLIHRVLLSVRM